MLKSFGPDTLFGRTAKWVDDTEYFKVPYDQRAPLQGPWPQVTKTTQITFYIIRFVIMFMFPGLD
jgi:hypothetical protein